MGASVEYIWSYLNQLGLSTKTSHLEDLLEKLPFLFNMQTTGVGALIERKWQFTGYKDTNVLSFLWVRQFLLELLSLNLLKLSMVMCVCVCEWYGVINTEMFVVQGNDCVYMIDHHSVHVNDISPFCTCIWYITFCKCIWYIITLFMYVIYPHSVHVLISHYYVHFDHHHSVHECNISPFCTCMWYITILYMFWSITNIYIFFDNHHSVIW